MALLDLMLWVITSQQVASFFLMPHASKKVVHADESEDEQDEYAEELNKIHEQNVQDLSNEIMAEILLQHLVTVRDKQNDP